jgi:hypothetical protein
MGYIGDGAAFAGWLVVQPGSELRNAVSNCQVKAIGPAAGFIWYLAFMDHIRIYIFNLSDYRQQRVLFEAASDQRPWGANERSV